MIFHSITHCSSRKASPPSVVLSGPAMTQAELAKKWCSKSSKISETETAANLYTGRGYRKLVSRIPKNQRLVRSYN